MSRTKFVCRSGQPLPTQAKHVPPSYTVQRGTVNLVQQVKYEDGCISSDGTIEVL